MLRSERRGPVLHLTLNRPEVRNAFNEELFGAITETFQTLPEETRAVVVRGEGKAFCAGGDLEWMKRAAGYSAEENFQDTMRLAGTFEAIVQSPALVIAQVHGAAFGGGAGLVACADVAIAHPDTLFAFSEVKLGLLPATISPFVIPKIGASHARALFTTGEAFGAERALRIGLVHEVAEDLEAAVARKLEAVLAAGPKAVAMAKQIAQRGFPNMEASARALAAARASEEGREGVAAFLEKRRAGFVSELRS